MLCYLPVVYKNCAARGVVCACYGGLTVGLDSRLPASCRGNSGEADDAEPESLDSGPQVSSNLLFFWRVWTLVRVHILTGLGYFLNKGAVAYVLSTPWLFS
jgi:hypothetical protein